VSVFMINSFEVPAGHADEFIAAWQPAADFLATRPGYVSTRLHRGLATDAGLRMVNVAEWAAAEQCQAAVTSAEFRSIAGRLAGYPSSPGFYSMAYEHHA